MNRKELSNYQKKSDKAFHKKREELLPNFDLVYIQNGIYKKREKK